MHPLSPPRESARCNQPRSVCAVTRALSPTAGARQLAGGGAGATLELGIDKGSSEGDGGGRGRTDKNKELRVERRTRL